MAPKKEQAAPITPATVANGLCAQEPNQQLQTVLQLANATFNADDIIQCAIPQKLVRLLQQQLDKSVTLLACRQLASYTAGRSPLQQAVASLEAVKALWSVLAAYHAAEHAIAAALADPAAAKAAAPKKPPAPKDAADPDDWLPGPSKYLLEACLRAMCSLINSAEAQQQNAAVAVDSSSGSDSTMPAGSSPAYVAAQASWLMQQDVSVLVCLLRHPSARVQMRAARLVHQLAKSSAWSDAFAAAAGVAVAAQLATSSSLTVRLSVLRLLLRLADNSHLADAVMVQSKQLMDALVMQLLEAGAQASPTTAVLGKGKAASGTAQHAATDVKSELALVQQAAADLLALLCSDSSSMSQQLVQFGGLTSLQALLPSPPLSAEEAASSSTSVSENGALSTDGTSRSPRQKQPASKQATPRGFTPAADAARQATPRSTAPATDALKQANPRAVTPAGGDSNPGKGTPRSTPLPGTPPDGEAALSSEPAEATGYPIPTGKVLLPEMQAKVLQVLAAVMSQPGMVQSMLLQPPQMQTSLPRVLLHMFAPPPVVATPAAADSQTAAQGAAETAAATGSKVGATAGAAVKGSAAAGKGPAAGAKKEQAITGAAGSGNTPRKTGTMGATAAKDPPKTPDAPLPLADPLAPPYSAITKAAALECLTHLTKDKQAVALLAEQQVQLPAGVIAAIAATSAGASGAALQQGPQQEQQQQQQQSAMCVSMLKQLLQDILQLAGVKDMQDANATGGSSNANSTQQADKTGAASPQEQQKQQPPALTAMLEGAAAVLGGIAENLDKQQQQELPLLPALKGLAQCGLLQQASLQAQQAIARALLLLPEELYVAPPRPPLPSPPATPPAPPLPTSQFAWDALDRPYITDGLVILTSNA